MSVKLAIHGAAGRMGRRVVALASQDPQIEIVAALESAGSHFLGQDAGLVAGGEKLGVSLSVVGESAADVVIDFSVPDAGIAIVDHCLKSKKPLVIATTGFESDQKEFIATAAEQIPIVFAPSMSTAVNLVMKLTEIAGRVLKDYPSGVDPANTQSSSACSAKRSNSASPRATATATPKAPSWPPSGSSANRPGCTA
jgi:4-hydroxy-tetrahydrodipicolinate reductase